MSRQEPDLPDLVGELARTTEQLRDELEAETGGSMRPPKPGELVRFTSEVTIPAIVLLLETNVRALRLLQRTLRFAQGRAEQPETSRGQARKRAEDLGRETLGRLDSALVDLQEALSGRPADDDTRELLEEARDLRSQVESRLEAAAGEMDGSPPEGAEPMAEDNDQPAEGTDLPIGGEDSAGDGEEVPVDVDAELQSIKDDVDDDSDE
jgi:hypothetical protein